MVIILKREGSPISHYHIAKPLIKYYMGRRKKPLKGLLEWGLLHRRLPHVNFVPKYKGFIQSLKKLSLGKLMDLDKLDITLIQETTGE